MRTMKIIVFTGGEAPEPESARIFLQNFLGDSTKPDYVVAADSGLETLRAWQDHYKDEYDFAPSAIVGDFDSISDKKILDGYAARLVERSPAYKDLTDTEMALKKALAIKSGNDRRRALSFSRATRESFGQKMSGASPTMTVLIGGAGGARADHFLGIYNLFGTPLAPDAWICGGQVFYKAERGSFAISGLKPGDTLSIARAFGKNSGGKIRSQGLEWESDVFRKRGMPSISNTIKEEWAKKSLPVKIDFLRGSFVLILPLWATVSR